MKRGAGDACVKKKRKKRICISCLVSVRLRAGRAHCSRWAVRVSIRPVPPVTWPLPALPAFLCFCSGAALGFSLASFGFSTASSACVRHAPGRAAAAAAVSGPLLPGGGFGGAGGVDGVPADPRSRPFRAQTRRGTATGESVQFVRASCRRVGLPTPEPGARGPGGARGADLEGLVGPLRAVPVALGLRRLPPPRRVAPVHGCRADERCGVPLSELLWGCSSCRPSLNSLQLYNFSFSFSSSSHQPRQSDPLKLSTTSASASAAPPPAAAHPHPIIP